MSCAAEGCRLLSTYFTAAAENEEQNMGFVKDLCRGAPIFSICICPLFLSSSSSSPFGFAVPPLMPLLPSIAFGHRLRRKKAVLLFPRGLSLWLGNASQRCSKYVREPKNVSLRLEMLSSSSTGRGRHFRAAREEPPGPPVFPAPGRVGWSVCSSPR